MFGYVKEKKYKELEDKLIHQERLFEARLTSVQQEHEIEVDSLVTKYEEDIKYLNHELNFAKANEQSLNAMTGSLSNKLLKFEAFPTKSFNHKKAVEVLTTKLTPKALASFNYLYIESLPIDQIQTIVKYGNSKLESINKLDNA